MHRQNRQRSNNRILLERPFPMAWPIDFCENGRDGFSIVDYAYEQCVAAVNKNDESSALNGDQCFAKI